MHLRCPAEGGCLFWPAHAQLKQYFPRDGSADTPPHPATSFRWKDYCPLAFRHLRAIFDIEPAQYMQSICGAQPCPSWLPVQYYEKV